VGLGHVQVEAEILRHHDRHGQPGQESRELALFAAVGRGEQQPVHSAVAVVIAACWISKS
jgi:hypothetical protein